MRKQVIVVSKTHLDLGFTDYAANILTKYIDNFIPNAIKIAKEVNTDKKKFVWTTGSWLINKALTIGTDKQKADVANALKKGDIVAHAFPFTTHTELMDGFLFEYGLSLVDKIDAIRGKKTISAKFSDVPGHTIAMLPYLAKKGIKLVHIGVNPASAVPKTPECFLWKYNDSEVIVIYSSKGYGGEFRTPFIDDILYFDHTHDNYGAKGKIALENSFNHFAKKYADFEVVAGSLDDYAEKLWEVRDKLPIVTAEIGDTWIHGVASAPRKVAVMRELENLVKQWIDDKTLTVGSEEYDGVMDNLLCIAEHTWGFDLKRNFADYENYLRKDFEKARKNNNVKSNNLIIGLHQKAYF